MTSDQGRTSGGDPKLGWYDDRNGEVGEIPVSLYAAQQIWKADLIDEMTGPDDTIYQVQKEWSNKANGPIVFAAATGRSATAPSACPAMFVSCSCSCS